MQGVLPRRLELVRPLHSSPSNMFACVVLLKQMRCISCLYLTSGMLQSHGVPSEACRHVAGMSRGASSTEASIRAVMFPFDGLTLVFRWRLLEGSMGIGNALPANPAVLRGANIVTFLMARAKQLGFNTFRCARAPGHRLTRLQHTSSPHWC